MAYEISLSARAAASLLLPRLADKKQVTAVLQRHPRVRGASGLVCTGTAENRQAWLYGEQFFSEAAARAEREISYAKSGREHWEKGFVI